MQIPWLFPDFSQYSLFPWPSTKFPDFSLTFAKSGISLTFPWPLDTLHLFKGRSKKTSKLHVVKGIHRWPLDSPHKRPVPRKVLSFDYIIMNETNGWWTSAKRYNVTYISGQHCSCSWTGTYILSEHLQLQCRATMMWSIFYWILTKHTP